jgi:hypothetical protein
MFNACVVSASSCELQAETASDPTGIPWRMETDMALCYASTLAKAEALVFGLEMSHARSERRATVGKEVTPFSHLLRASSGRG